MASREKCPVKGCLGYVEITTNGGGRTVERCPCCEKREAWRRQHLPARTARCAVCGAEWEHKGTGKLPAACDACKPLWERRKKRAAKSSYQASRPAVRRVS